MAADHPVAIEPDPGQHVTAEGLDQSQPFARPARNDFDANRTTRQMRDNLFDQGQEMAGIADYVEQSLRDETLSGSAIEKSIVRVAKRKMLLIG